MAVPRYDQTQRQDGEPVGEAGRIQRQGHTSTAPALEDPGQQRREAGGDVEFAAPFARLGGGRLVELLESGAKGVKAYLQAQLVSLVKM